jgi:hypothetical protein
MRVIIAMKSRASSASHFWLWFLHMGRYRESSERNGTVLDRRQLDPSREKVHNLVEALA